MTGLRPGIGADRRGLLPIGLLLAVVAASLVGAARAPEVSRDLQIDSQRAVTQQFCLSWPATTQPATRKAIVANGNAALDAEPADVKFEDQTNQIEPGHLLTVPKVDGEVGYSVEGAAAGGMAGLAYTRTNAGIAQGLALQRCQSAAAEWWFGGLASTSGEGATLTMYNPDNEDVVAAVSGYTIEGKYKTAVGNRVLVRARQVANVDLTALFPAQQSLAVRVVVNEGRVAAAVAAAQVKGVAALGRSSVSGVAELAPTAVIAGVPRQNGGSLLQILSPTEDAIAAVQVSTAKGSFTLSGADRVTLQAGKVQTFELPGKLWDSAATIIVESSASVLASVRQLHSVGDAIDLNIQTQQPQLAGRGVAISPDNLADERLIAYSQENADVAVSAYRAGKLLWTVTTRVAAGCTQELKLLAPLVEGGILTVSSSVPVAVTHWVAIGAAKAATSSSVAVVEQSADLVAGASLDLAIS